MGNLGGRRSKAKAPSRNAVSAAGPINQRPAAPKTPCRVALKPRVALRLSPMIWFRAPTTHVPATHRPPHSYVGQALDRPATHAWRPTRPARWDGKSDHRARVGDRVEIDEAVEFLVLDLRQRRRTAYSNNPIPIGNGELARDQFSPSF
jgi:hypothetical protein